MGEALAKPRGPRGRTRCAAAKRLRMEPQGTGPAATKVGKHVRYSRKAVDQWLAARTETPLAS
jgi:hypothetical protein